MFSIAIVDDLYAITVRYDFLAIDEEFHRRVGITNLDVKNCLLPLNALLKLRKAFAEGVVI